MKYRYTLEEIKNVNLENKEAVRQFLINIMEDRKDSLTNVYSPLYRKITQVQNWIADKKL